MKANYMKKSHNVFNHKIFYYNDFNATSFINFIMENFHLNNNYSILIKFWFSGNSIFYMSGKQIGLKIENSHDLKYYSHIYNVIIIRILDIMGKNYKIIFTW